MKQRPILFSDPMVQAILAGNKTQTRRKIKPQPEIDRMGNFNWNRICYGQGPDGQPLLRDFIRSNCPYGRPGDLLWVREAWGCAADGSILYRADNNGSPPNQWRPSIYMPRSASRILLELTEVRAERLHGISPDDAAAEGAADIQDFAKLWQNINGANCWCSNPWVWVLSFRLAETTAKDTP